MVGAENLDTGWFYRLIPGKRPIEVGTGGHVQAPEATTQAAYPHQPSALRSVTRMGVCQRMPFSGMLTHNACCGGS